MDWTTGLHWACSAVVYLELVAWMGLGPRHADVCMYTVYMYNIIMSTVHAHVPCSRCTTDA